MNLATEKSKYMNTPLEEFVPFESTSIDSRYELFKHMIKVNGNGEVQTLVKGEWSTKVFKQIFGDDYYTITVYLHHGDDGYIPNNSKNNKYTISLHRCVFFTFYECKPEYENWRNYKVDHISGGVDSRKKNGKYDLRLVTSSVNGLNSVNKYTIDKDMLDSSKMKEISKNLWWHSGMNIYIRYNCFQYYIIIPFKQDGNQIGRKDIREDLLSRITNDNEVDVPFSFESKGRLDYVTGVRQRRIKLSGGKASTKEYRKLIKYYTRQFTRFNNHVASRWEQIPIDTYKEYCMLLDQKLTMKKPKLIKQVNNNPVYTKDMFMNILDKYDSIPSAILLGMVHMVNNIPYTKHQNKVIMEFLQDECLTTRRIGNIEFKRTRKDVNQWIEFLDDLNFPEEMHTEILSKLQMKGGYYYCKSK